MTKDQRISLQAVRWPKACQAQGWQKDDRDLRLRVCMWAISLEKPSLLELLNAINSDRQPPRQLDSTNALNNKDDIDQVFACLGMLADNLKKTEEVSRPDIGAARRKRDVIRGHVKCLGLYREHPRRLLAKLVSDMFDSRDRFAGGRELTIRDLDDQPQFYTDRKTQKLREGPSQLQRLLMRLAGMVNDARNENILVPKYHQWQGTIPLTGHEMKMLAGTPCDCATCTRMRAASKAPPIITPLEENWADFDPELDMVEAPF